VWSGSRMCAAEAGELLVLVVESSNALVDLRMLPIWAFPTSR
jgi:hypothetical protein